LVHLPIKIGSLSVTALVDTGTDRAIDLPTSILRQLPLSDFPHPVGEAEGVTGRSTIAEAALDADLVVGQHRVGRPRVTFSESFEFPILGSIFFHEYIVTIDQRNRRMRLVRASSSRAKKS
jgi:hypothetical protein